MAERSKRIILKIDKDKFNKETNKLYKKYEIDMNIKELSEKTIYNYKCDLFAWFSYIYIFQNNKSITEIDEDDLTEFFYFCKSEGNNSRRIKRRMASISAMYLYLKKKRLVKENPMEFIDRPRKDTDVVVQTFLTQEQVNELIEKLRADKKNLQLLTYICLGLSTMARVNALANIKWDMIDFEENTINNVKEKEGYIVSLDFDDFSKSLLLELKKEREINNIKCDYVFVTNSKGIWDKPNNSTLNQWCKRAGSLIGVPTLHNHDLRHSGATIIKNNGASLEDVSKMLNHMSTDVTLKHYIKEDTSKLKKTKEKYGVLRNFNNG